MLRSIYDFFERNVLIRTNINLLAFFILNILTISSVGGTIVSERETTIISQSTYSSQNGTDSVKQVNGVKWEKGTFNEALQKAQKTGKLIFMDCYTSWCGPCRHMSNTVFTTAKAGDYFNEKFINVKYDMEKGEGIALKNKYSVEYFPTFLIIDSTGNELGRVIGALDLDPFIQKVEYAANRNNSLDNLLAKFMKSKDFDDAINYLEVAHRGYLKDKIIDFFVQYYDSLNDRARINQNLWKYMEQAISLSKPGFFHRVVNDKYTFNRYFGKEKVDKELASACAVDLSMYITGETIIDKDVVIEAANILKYISNSPDRDMAIIETSILLANSKINGDNINVMNWSDSNVDYRNLSEKSIKDIEYSFNPSAIFYTCNIDQIGFLRRIVNKGKCFTPEFKKRFITLIAYQMRQYAKRIDPEPESNTNNKQNK